MKKLKEKLNAKLSKNGGFTLVEMLIVVAIIAILIAVSIPLVSDSLEKAREATDDANLRAAVAIGNMYYLSNPDEDYSSGVEKWYVIDSGHEGSLGAKPSKGYGKGTSAGSDTTPHTKDALKVTIKDPPDSGKSIVTVEWEKVET